MYNIKIILLVDFEFILNKNTYTNFFQQYLIFLFEKYFNAQENLYSYT